MTILKYRIQVQMKTTNMTKEEIPDTEKEIRKIIKKNNQ